MFGFLGRPDDLLTSQMETSLAHRDDGTWQSASHNGVTIAARSSIHKVGLVPAGICDFPHHDMTVALCGFVIGIDDHELTNADPQHVESFYERLGMRFRADGAQLFTRIRGSFICAIRDGHHIHLTRDGAGNRTVFYGQAGGRWMFAIEPKAITQCSDFQKRIRPAAIAQYLTCSFVPGSHTMLENLYELQAGHTITFSGNASPSLQRWFKFERDEPAADDPVEEVTSHQWTNQFRTEMERAVAERIPRGEPVGLFLSGGLDSSVVAAELARQLGGDKVRTWAIHFGKKYHNELEFARAVAERCGTVHEEVCIQPRNFLQQMRRMIWHLDEPIGDPITQPNFDLAAHVSQEVRFIFNGEGGDPCFGGPKNIPMMLQHWYGGLAREPNFRERHYLASYRRAWSEIDFLLSDDVRAQIDLEADLDGVFAPYLRDRPPRLFLNRLTSINIREKGAHLIQPKVERMLGAHGVTPLAPLFDERLVRFSFQMPARLKLHQGVEKVVLKQAYKDDLPEQIIKRPKSGMRVPVHYWLRGEMKRYARRILNRREIERVGLFNPQRVKQLLAYDIEEGQGRYGLRLWMLITFELWRRIVVEGEPL